MSTIKTMNLIVQERDAFAATYQAMHQLIMVRGLQVVEANRETELAHKDSLSAENNAEAAYALIYDVAKEFMGTLGHSGSVLNALHNIRNRMHGLAQECERLRENAKRYEKLIDLCKNGKREPGEWERFDGAAECAITTEVDRLKAEGLPF